MDGINSAGGMPPLPGLPSGGGSGGGGAVESATGNIDTSKPEGLQLLIAKDAEYWALLTSNSDQKDAGDGKKVNEYPDRDSSSISSS